MNNRSRAVAIGLRGILDLMDECRVLGIKPGQKPTAPEEQRLQEAITMDIKKFQQDVREGMQS